MTARSATAGQTGDDAVMEDEMAGCVVLRLARFEWFREAPADVQWMWARRSLTGQWMALAIACGDFVRAMRDSLPGWLRRRLDGAA